MNAADLFNHFFVNGPNVIPLEPDQLNVAREVFPIVFDEMIRHGIVLGRLDDDDDNVGFNPRIQTLRRNLRIIIRCFRRSQEARVSYLDRFPRWDEDRTKTTTTLSDVADSINLDRFNCNVSRIVGSCVSFLGSVATIVSIAFPPAAAILVPAAVTAGLGAVTTFGATAAEIGLLKTKTDLAKETTRQDQERFHEDLQDWFENTIALRNAVEAALGFEVAGKLAQDLKDFVGQDVIGCRNFEANLRNGIKTLLKTAAKQLIPYGGEACIIITFFVVVVLLHRRNYMIFDCAVFTFRVVFGLLSLLDVGVDVTGAIAAAMMRGGAAAAEKLSESLLRAVFHGVFAGVSSVLDLINIALTSKDIHWGSVSEQAQEIKKVTDQLVKQQRVLREVYDELRRGANAA